jgi:hypothetical protein
VDAGDLRLPLVPAEPVVGEQPDDDERCSEGDDPDGERSAPLPPQLWNVDFGACEEGEQHAGERADERKPARHVEVQRVADDETREELDQRDREPQLDRHNRREQDRCGEDY